jgi:hypothetical protein|tara:strand:- start:146 stop:316 length:171 start_codon:yes stop_codon:yes gene_type:complete
MSRDFVDSVLSGDNAKAQDDFKASISDKVGETLEVKRREYAKTFVSTLPQTVEDDA